MSGLDEKSRELIERLNFAHVATLRRDGSPQVSPVWVDHDGAHVLINTAKGRAKAVNLSRDGRVAISIADSENPYRYLLIEGEVAEITEDGALEHFSKLCWKYTGSPVPDGHTETRLLVRILPSKVIHGDDSPAPKEA